MKDSYSGLVIGINDLYSFGIQNLIDQAAEVHFDAVSLYRNHAFVIVVTLFLCASYFLSFTHMGKSFLFL